MLAGSYFRSLSKRCHFFPGQVAPFSKRKGSQREFALPDPAEPDNLHTSFSAHPAHLPVSTFVDSDQKFGFLLIRAHKLYLRLSNTVTIQCNGSGKQVFTPCPVSSDPHLIGFIHLGTGVHKAIGKGSVVCK